MKQYVKIKEKHKAHLLFFRLGDFYELFFDDAVVASTELEIVLTGKECGLSERAPMCGIPYHSADSYIKKLIDKGFKIAICEQVEKMSSTKNLVEREVVRIITPGTVFEPDFLQSGLNNYICSVFLESDCFSACFCDVSTGVVNSTKIKTQISNIPYEIVNEMERFIPVEVLYNNEVTDFKEIGDYLTKKLKCVGSLIDLSGFDEAFCKKTIIEQFEKVPVEVLNSKVCLKSISMLLVYLKETQKQGINRLVELNFYDRNRYLGLDFCVRKSLELTQTLNEGKKQKSLFWVVDKTKTAMGKRLLRKLIEQPLINLHEIKKRQDAVEILNKNLIVRDEILELLSKVFDLERLMTKIVYGSVNARELKSFSYTLEQLPKIKQKLELIPNDFFEFLNKQISNMTQTCDLINRAISEEPPVNFKEGGVIAKGFNSKLDELRELNENSKNLILKIEQKERERTKINKLKIKYNKVFGYFIEISNSFLNKVPDNYIRKQTVSSGERFITTELKEIEYKILQASEQSLEIEHEIFEKIKKAAASKLLEVQLSAKALATLDVLCSFSIVSIENNYTKPKMTTNNEIIIKNGRHPVIELINSDYFIANDTQLDCSKNIMMLITGPNMAGKSTYMRQVVLIVIMAQMGCFVPAESATIGIVDKIFTRIGAHDDLTSGQSTFMVEMNEVAKILQNATNKSLIIFDEIGRGTSTYDGISIAKSVAEHILTNKHLKCKTLFATHYHELISLENEVFGVKNYSVAVKDYGNKISFLRKIVEGGANDSYGIAVAQLAGLPVEVISRANSILNEIEQNKLPLNDHKKDLPAQKTETELDKVKLNVIEQIENLQIENMTPIEAFSLLHNLQYKLKNEVL